MRTPAARDRPGSVRGAKVPVPLTDRQRQVLQLRVAGASWREIGRRLGVAPPTALQHYRYAIAKAERWARAKGRQAGRQFRVVKAEDSVGGPAVLTRAAVTQARDGMTPFPDRVSHRAARDGGTPPPTEKQEHPGEARKGR